MIDKAKYYNKNLNEECYFQQMDNGLKVYIIKKPGFKGNIALFSTKYGSNNIAFKINDKHYEMPLGVAHFLEHKLFACKDGVDASVKFSDLNLSCNAYTGYGETTYYFVGTKNFNEGIITLLDFVQEPFFTDENVDNEKGIIIQELKMYSDMPKERQRFAIKNNLFFNNPIKNDIGGTIDSVKAITKEDLYFCHKVFYHPSNMVLVLAGDCDPEEIFKMVENNQSKKTFGEKIPFIFDDYNEPQTIQNEYSELEMDVALPKLIIGIKLPQLTLTPEEHVLDRICVNQILNHNFGSTTRFYESLIKKDLIKSALKYGYTNYDGARFITISCDTIKIDLVTKILKEKISKLPFSKIPKTRTIISKRNLIGCWVSAFNAVNDEAMDFLDYYYDNINIFDLFEIFKSIKHEDVIKKCATLSVDTISINVIYPKKDRTN